MERNGIDTAMLDGFVDQMVRQPDGGRGTVRTRHRWDTGFAVHGVAERLEQFGQGPDRTHHTFRSDWPTPLGEDTGATPGAEGILATVGACVATTYAVHAARRGVKVHELEIVTEGTVDLYRLFEIDPSAPGVRGISLTLRVQADADAEVLAEIGRACSATSPAFGAVANPTPLELRIDPVEG
jgi:uncharacterized OsmC-like protein